MVLAASRSAPLRSCCRVRTPAHAVLLFDPPGVESVGDLGHLPRRARPRKLETAQLGTPALSVLFADLHLDTHPLWHSLVPSDGVLLPKPRTHSAKSSGTARDGSR